MKTAQKHQQYALITKIVQPRLEPRSQPDPQELPMEEDFARPKAQLQEDPEQSFNIFLLNKIP